MTLVNPQPIQLLQTGDLVEGAGFDNWLDAVDASFCTFDGGDDPEQDGIYPDPLPGGFNGENPVFLSYISTTNNAPQVLRAVVLFALPMLSLSPMDRMK